MKRLFIVRHAKAEEGVAGQADFDRPLTQQGQTDAQMLGRFLTRENLLPQKILVSPARRTLQTFMQINASLNTDYEECAEIYNAEFEDLRALLSSTGDKIKSLMLIGHNPGVHALGLYFSGPGEEPQKFPPASLLVLDFDGEWKAMLRHGGKRIVFREP